MTLEYLNHPPVVPSGCSTLTDQTKCTKSGDIVHFTRDFGESTPPGKGVEVVLDRDGCVVRSRASRGAALSWTQTSLQATGKQAKSLLSLTRRGCLDRQLSLFTEDGDKVKLHSGLFGVAGRYRLTKAGAIVAPSGSGSFFARNPRTIAGRAADGTIMLVTIDGRQTTSVGTTMAETAAVAQSLGLTDALNLDGGGSTTMSVRGAVTNQVPGGKLRSVGDALVYVNTPFA